MAGAFGTDGGEIDSWQAAAEITMDPLLVGLSGAEIVTGMGLRNTYTLLYPESIILDDDIYHRARNALLNLEVNPETLALDVIQNVGPGGHFLAQKHTRKHMRHAMERSVTHQLNKQSQYRDPLEVAREKITWILENHEVEPLDPAKQAELGRILQSAEREFKSD